jgi:aspartyl-tRNA(Asn)/glutamyl-tRNA(Gln) amidotransferase subunit A
MSDKQGPVREHLEASLEKISKLGVEATRIFIAIDRERARRDADEVDTRVAAGESLPLAGVICSIKDLIDRHGERTTAGSQLLETRDPASADATIVTQLEAAGAVILGRTNLTEFAYSGVGLNPHHGTPGCIYDKKQIPGGSSCGAALSVAHGVCDIAIGTDTGGSVRVPAAINGLFGIKPTANSVSTNGVHPLSAVMDSVGPIGADWSLTRRTMNVLQNRAVTQTSDSVQRIGVARGLLTDALDAPVNATFAHAQTQLKEGGIELVDIDLDWLAEVALANRTLIACEAMDQYASHFKQLEKVGDAHILKRMRFAEKIDAETREAAEALRIASIARFSDALESAGVNTIIAPTVPITTPTIADAKADFETINAQLLRNTSLINFVDGCSVSLPVSYKDEVPGALMVSAATGQDEMLLNQIDVVAKLLS